MSNAKTEPGVKQVNAVVDLIWGNQKYGLISEDNLVGKCNCAKEILDLLLERRFVLDAGERDYLVTDNLMRDYYQRRGVSLEPSCTGTERGSYLHQDFVIGLDWF